MEQAATDGVSLITPDAIAAHTAAEIPSTATYDFETGRAELAIILSIAEGEIGKGTAPGIITDQMAARLHLLRKKSHPSVWMALAEEAQRHRISSYFWQDPFTRHSFDKPRGYSGDAQLLDYIYHHPAISAFAEQSTPLGFELYHHVSNGPPCAAVRERRDLLTKEVDRVSNICNGDAEILTIAAGHLREADASEALREGKIKRWIALDQDPLSIGEITKNFPGTPIAAVDGSVKGILSNIYRLGEFDLVYAAGLYDYLPRAIAIKLTRKCMAMLKPGGSFLFANFAEEVSSDGYMETFMNWALLLRSDADMWDIVNKSVDRNKVDATVFYGENRNIVYGRITKLD